MKKLSIFLTLILSSYVLFAQQKKDKGAFTTYKNTFYQQILKENGSDKKLTDRKVFKMDYTGVDIPKSVSEFKTIWSDDPQSQGSTGTCWAFSTTSYYESEIYRITGKKINLSQMYIVYWEYVEKAKEYVRTRGKSAFGEGSETNAPKRMMKLHGIVPYSAYQGQTVGMKYFDHRKMFGEMKSYLQGVKTTSAWNTDVVEATIKSILNHYIGVPPTKVTVDGKTMTPEEYLKNVTKLNPDDYIDFMSLMEEPYWKQSLYDVNDNWWRSADYYNVPLDDFMNIIKNAVKAGYPVCIGGDVSESGISPENDVAMVPSYDIPSKYIDENARQMRFSNHSTTDDHAILLIGYVEKPNGTWFLIKDSGSSSFNGKNEGHYFYHEDFVKLKMMTYTINKESVKDILKKF